MSALRYNSRSLAGEALRFLIVGGIATALQFAILVAMVRWGRWDAAPASAFGFMISMWLSYAMNRRFTFASNQPHAYALPRFLATAMCGLGLTVVGMHTLVSIARVDYLLAQVVVTAMVTAWNFALNRWWSFRPAEAP